MSDPFDEYLNSSESPMGIFADEFAQRCNCDLDTVIHAISYAWGVHYKEAGNFEVPRDMAAKTMLLIAMLRGDKKNLDRIKKANKSKNWRDEQSKISDSFSDDEPQNPTSSVSYQPPWEDSQDKLRSKLDSLGNDHRQEMIETGYGSYPRHKHKSMEEIRERNTERGMEIARAEAKSGWVNPRVDPFCCPTPGYVPPTIKRSGCGLLALIIPALLILSQVII